MHVHIDACCACHVLSCAGRYFSCVLVMRALIRCCCCACVCSAVDKQALLCQHLDKAKLRVQEREQAAQKENDDTDAAEE